MINQLKYWDGAKPGPILLLITIKFYQFAKIIIVLESNLNYIWYCNNEMFENQTQMYMIYNVIIRRTESFSVLYVIITCT